MFKIKFSLPIHGQKILFYCLYVSVSFKKEKMQYKHIVFGKGRASAEWLVDQG